MRSASAPADDQPRAPRVLPGAVAGVLAADYLWPTLAGAAAGAFTLARLTGAAGRLSVPPPRPRPGAGTGPGPGAAEPGGAASGADRPAPETLTPPDLPVPPAASERGTGPSFTFLPNP